MNAVLQFHIVIIFLSFFQNFGFIKMNEHLELFVAFSLILFFIMTILTVFFKHRIKEFATTYVLSSIFNFCLCKLLYTDSFLHIQIYIYLISLCIYHFMEYAFVCAYHIQSLSFDSKIL